MPYPDGKVCSKALGTQMPLSSRSATSRGGRCHDARPRQTPRLAPRRRRVVSSTATWAPEERTPIAHAGGHQKRSTDNCAGIASRRRTLMSTLCYPATASIITRKPEYIGDAPYVGEYRRWAASSIGVFKTYIIILKHPETTRGRGRGRRRLPRMAVFYTHTVGGI